MVPYKCSYCANVSIESLAILAEKEFKAHDFPQHAYLEHHRNIKDLESSSESGCELCKVILESCRRTQEDWFDGSVYDAAIDLASSPSKATDIKMCLNTVHVFVGDSLAKVEVWDTILVQIGKIAAEMSGMEGMDIDDPAFDEIDNYTLKPVGLLIKTSPAEYCSLNKRRIGRFETDADLASNTNFDIARSWLKQCDDEHTTCALKDEPALPTRVIDVGETVGSNQPRLLVTNGSRARYTALSHCWGGKISLALKMNNIDEFQTAIPWQEFAQNFKDAVLITQQLGYRYLWIDCMCIMQDSESDWARESSMMANIYQNSSLTILASASEHSDCGILSKKTSPREWKPSRTRIKVFQVENTDTFVDVESWDSEASGKGQEALRDLSDGSGILSERGWTLQEWCLSPRKLYYGSEKIFWECQKLYEASDGSPKGLLFPQHDQYHSLLAAFRGNEARDQPQPTDEATVSILDEYYRLMSGYTLRSLTYGSDKLPAISGICARLHHVIGGDYLAGLWSIDMHNGLLWYKEMPWCKHVSRYRAPSWSWAVTDDKILFEPRSSRRNDSGLTIIDYDIQHKAQVNKYGEVVSAHLIVEGLTFPLYRSSQTKLTYEGSIGTARFDEPKTGAVEGDNQDVLGDLFCVETGDVDKDNCLVSMRFDYPALRSEQKELHQHDARRLGSLQPTRISCAACGNGSRRRKKPDRTSLRSDLAACGKFV